MKTGYTPEQGRGFVRPGETEKQQNRGFSDIKKAAPIRSRLSEQFTCRAKNKFEQGNYISQVTKRHNCRITDKTKATGGGRQWENTKHKPGHHSDLLAGGQCDQCAGLLVGYSCSLALRRWSSSRATATSCPISSAALTPIFSTCASASSEEIRGFSPLPSAWRRAISPRTAVTIKFALVSPGCRDASMPLTTSCGNLAFSCCDLLLTELVDMFAPPINNGMQCNTKVNTKKDLKCYSPKRNLNTTRADTCNSAIETTKPRTVGAVTGLLTTNRYER
ncbi:TPA: icd-like protein [Escherichia coli]|nr:icd-like protein [Escherichia coli O17]HDZ3832289.1 icd-like protein [Escherichia coli]HDZ3862081.1 icd-like protein [Escherichia coli]HDZ3881518.1 icd-like protein [Escherichia coli]HDZ3896742.1 icd-like protein [Escherichia coli]